METLEQISSLNELEYSIYSYLKSNKDKVTRMKVSDISKELHVSPAMITRMCQKLGYEGFSEYKLQARLAKEDRDVTSENNIEYLLDFFNRANNDRFDQHIDKIVTQLQDAQDVLLMGVGLSGALAKYGAFLFNRKGLKCFFIDDFSHRVTDIYNKDTTVIMFTVSGNTKEINDQIVQFKKSGVKVIVITNSESSTSAKLADMTITYYVPSDRNQFFFSSATQVPVMYILECVANKL